MAPPDSVVVDTDVVSYVFKGDTRTALYEPHLSGRTLLVSFMTLAELDLWARSRQWGERRRGELETFLRRFTVVDSDRAVCRTWAEVSHEARQHGFQIGAADCWIAATALLYDVPLVTHNRAHFEPVAGLTIISEAP